MNVRAASFSLNKAKPRPESRCLCTLLEREENRDGAGGGSLGFTVPWVPGLCLQGAGQGWSQGTAGGCCCHLRARPPSRELRAFLLFSPCGCGSCRDRQLCANKPPSLHDFLADPFPVSHTLAPPLDFSGACSGSAPSSQAGGSACRLATPPSPAISWIYCVSLHYLPHSCV